MTTEDGAAIPPPPQVDLVALMEKRLPSYVINCLRAAGFDELEVKASMDIIDGEESSTSKIERYIEKRHKGNRHLHAAQQNL